jgi:hypothetical protein
MLLKDQGRGTRAGVCAGPGRGRASATSSDDVISAQVKGTYDITGGNYVSYIQWEQAGQANLDIFAEGSVMEPGAQGIYTMPDSHIKTLAEDLPMKPEPLGVSKQVAAVMALDNYPLTTSPVGAVDPVRLQLVVDVVQQFLAFPKFDINTMLMGG